MNKQMSKQKKKKEKINESMAYPLCYGTHSTKDKLKENRYLLIKKV